jgi:hypothetical protein
LRQGFWHRKKTWSPENSLHEAKQHFSWS